MHSTYLDKAVQKQIAIAYKANSLPSVQLQGFFTPQTYKILLSEIGKAKYTEQICADICWKRDAKAPKFVSTLFSSPVFKQLIKTVTGKTIKGQVYLMKFGPGNYTLRQDEQKPQGIVMYFDCTNEWNSKWGGAFVVANEYGELARVQPLANTVVIVDCTKAWPFIQYVNHYAKKERFMLYIS